MTETPNDDQPGFVAEEPVHCFACFRLIRPGQTYYLTIEHEVLCADCILTEGVIRVRQDLAVEVKRDRLLVQRGKAEVTMAYSRGSGLSPGPILNRLSREYRPYLVTACQIIRVRRAESLASAC